MSRPPSQPTGGDPRPPLVIVADDAPGSPMAAHRAGAGHPERPERLAAALAGVAALPAARTRRVTPAKATPEHLARVHTAEHVEFILSLRGRSFVIDADTAGGPESAEAALLAAGAAVTLVEHVVRERAAGLALVRPPGHHAEAGRAMGFCLFNNIAVAAAHAVEALGLRRVLIVDWDVHHGNGTQRIFESRADVLVFNIHEDGNYPGTGEARETGVGPGEGFTINLPMPSGSGDAEYLAALERTLTPAAEGFRPDLVLVSAGFDAHGRDPLGGMRLTAAGFGAMTALVRGIARRHAQGRLGLILEGGYDLDALTQSVGACAAALSGHDGSPRP